MTVEPITLHTETSQVGVPPAFHVMVKPRGAICNLGCQYCYFLSKEDLYPGSKFRMSDETLVEFTRQYIEAQQVPEVTFGWQGGEPTLMGLDFFRRAVALQDQYRRPGMNVINALQTNGTTLDEDWCRFFHDHNFLLGVSMDGPSHLHDKFRSDKGGNPTHERVLAGIRLLQKHGVEFNILTTVNAGNAEHPLEVYRYFRDEVGAQFIQFIPIVERENATGYQEGTQVTARSVTGKQYGDFLVSVFDEWVRRDVGRMYVQIFDVALGTWYQGHAGLCIFQETCGTGLALEHNGDLYACDHYVEPSYHLGNIHATPLTALVSTSQQRAFGQAKRDTLPAYCRSCDVRFICHGECPKNRILNTPDGEPGLNYLCEGYKKFFRHIDQPMRFMAGQLGAQRPPANVMQFMAQQDIEMARRFAKATRNDPCPCGSGRKYKQCHGRTERT